MKYQEFIAQLKNQQEEDVPERVWHKISSTLQEKQERSTSWFLHFLPGTALAGAMAAIIVIIVSHSIQQAQLNSYLQTFSPSENIAQEFEFPG